MYKDHKNQKAGWEHLLDSTTFLNKKHLSADSALIARSEMRQLNP